MFNIQKHSPAKSPLVISCPHAGTFIPKDLLDAFRTKDPIVLKQDSDLFVDTLYETAYDLGASFISTAVSRYVIDLNRNPLDNDASFVIHGKNSKNPKFLGLVAHKTTKGEPLLKSPLTPEQLQDRIRKYHEPFYKNLQDLISESLNHFGFCIHLDVHSMPSKAAQGHLDHEERADIVPSDRNGKSCHKNLINFVSDFFRHKNFSVRTNYPYQGGFITQHFGDPGKNIHTLQLELNRKLYMDEDTKEKIPEKFLLLQKTLTELISQLVKFKIP